MAEGYAIKVEGVQDTLRAFGRISKGLRRELGLELKKIAGLVAVDAKAIAEFLGLRDSGKLIGSIRPGLRGSVAYVTATAQRNGFNYPAVYEFGHGRERAFLTPAARLNVDNTVRGMEHLLDRLISDAGFGTGGSL
jgi:hypothetical protein